MARLGEYFIDFIGPCMLAKFFFDENNLVTDQFAMLDKDDLKKFKSLNKCEWEEGEHIKSHSDYTRHNAVGLCKSRRLKYEFKSDFGLFEVSQIKIRVGRSGGPLDSLSQPFFLTIEVAEINPYRYAKPYENVSFLTNLYLKKGYGLRRISNELGCSKATVRKKLIQAGIMIKEPSRNEQRSLKVKIEEMRQRGMSYQVIADTLNLWKISTSSNEGKWHAKTVRDISLRL